MPIIQYSYLWANNQRIDTTPEHDNFRRFFEIAGPFWKRYLIWRDVATFAVILPQNEIQKFEQILHSSCLSEFSPIFHLIPQESLFPESLKDVRKSRVQMLSKLLIAHRIPTEYYLVIDDDVILKRPFGFNDLFANRTKQTLRFTTANVFHSYWWNGSMEVLGIVERQRLEKKLKIAMKHNRLLNVTPQIMVRDVVMRLCDHIERNSGISALLSTESSWTEYTLYWLFLMVYDNPYKYYSKSRIRISEDNTNIWFDAQDTQDFISRIRDMLKNKSTYFSLIQSNAPTHTVDYVKKHLAEALREHRPSSGAHRP